MTTFRTIAPHNYLPPSQKDIQEMAKKVGLRTFSQDLVEDLCNIQAGGSYIPEHQIVDKLRRSDYLDKCLTTNRKGEYVYRGLEYLEDFNKNYVKDKVKARELASLKEVKYQRNIQNFVRSLDISNVPGVSPLEKSLSLVKILSTQEGGELSNHPEEKDSLPIFNQSQEKLADKINKTFEAISNLDYHEKQLLDFTGPLGDKNQLSIAEDMLNGKEVMLQIKRNLDKLVKLRTGKQVKLTSDPNGNEVRYRPINDFSEIDRLNPGELIYTKNYLNYRIVSGTSTVRERCSKQEKKQLLLVLVDCSGSMQDGNNYFKAGGVLMNRLKAVPHEAEIVFSFFHRKLEEEYTATTLDEARELMSKIKYQNFNEGSTAIAFCIKEAIKRTKLKLKNDSSLTAPQIMVVTDGCDDTTDLKVKDLGGIVLNAIIVGGTNDHLLKIARQSGGVAISNI